MNARKYEENIRLGLLTFLLAFVLFTGAFAFLQHPLDLLTGSIVSTFFLFGSIAVLFTTIFAITAFKYHQYIEPEVTIEYVQAVVQPTVQQPSTVVQANWQRIRKSMQDDLKDYLKYFVEFVEIFSATNELGLSKAKAQGFRETQYQAMLDDLASAGVLEPVRQGVTPKFSAAYVHNPQKILVELSKYFGYDVQKSLEFHGLPTINTWQRSQAYDASPLLEVT